MRKLKTTKEAIMHFINWRRTPVNENIPAQIMPRQFMAMPPGAVKQKPWDGSLPHRCYDNAHLAPDNYSVISGWMMSPGKYKLGHNIKTKKPLLGWILTAHFWNVDKTTGSHVDGTPFILPSSVSRKTVPYTDKDMFYLADTEILELMLDFTNCGFPLSIPSSLALLETGEIYKLVASDNHLISHIDFNRGYTDSGWAPLLWDELILNADGSTKVEFQNAFEKVIDLRDSRQ